MQWLFNIKWAEVYVCVLNMFTNTKFVETGLSLWVNILIAIINRIETCSGEGRYILPWKRPQTTPPNKTWTSIRPAASFHLGVGNLTPPQKKNGALTCILSLRRALRIWFASPIWGVAHILPRSYLRRCTYSTDGPIWRIVHSSGNTSFFLSCYSRRSTIKQSGQSYTYNMS